MKLLVVGGVWPPETFLIRKLEGLAKAGLDVTVASNCRTSRVRGLRGVRHIRLEVADHGRVRRLLSLFANLLSAARFPRQTWAIWKLCEQQGDASRLRAFRQLLPFASVKPDVLHFEWNFAAVQYRPLFDLFRCPAIVSCRGTQAHVAPHNPGRKAEVDLLPVTFRKAAAIHCVSTAIRNEAIRLGGSPEKMHVIRPAVDPTVFCPAGRKQRDAQGRFRILTTGSIAWVKGYEYALQAIRMLVDRGIDAHWTLIGKGEKTDRQRLLYTIHDLELVDRVHLLGVLDPDQVVTELQNSDAFLLSSVSEGISNAVLEAMSCAVPVVTTDCGGMREAVQNGVEGFVVGVRCPASTADALERLARDPEAGCRMGERGRDRVLREFQLSQQTEKWVGLYNRLAGAKPALAHPAVLDPGTTEA